MNSRPSPRDRRLEAAFHRSFREIYSIAVGMAAAGAMGDPHLEKLLRDTLHGQASTEYPFVLSCAFCRKPSDGKRVARIAAAVHLLQTSNMVTDDIFDGADSRYYRQTMWRKYGVSHAVIASELLQAVAWQHLSVEIDGGRFANGGEVLRLLARIVKEVYLCQFLDLCYTGKTGVSMRQYYRMIALGAGRFFGSLAECGALLAGKPAGEVRSLRTFGFNYGMALFISDDVMDVVLSPGQTGKNFATDLKQRRMRLPVILALARGSRSQKRWLRRFLESRDPSPRAVREAAALIRDTGAPQACLAIARQYLARSLRALDGVSSRYSHEHLAWLAGSLLRDQGLEP